MKKATLRYAKDPQTGQSFQIVHEGQWDTVASIVSILYSMVMLVFLSWLLLDLCTDNKALLKLLRLQDAEILDSPFFRLIAYAVIGGGLGGTINGIRSFVVWHCERKAYGGQFLWKDLSLPLLGAVLAAIVYALVRGGVAAFGGGFSSDQGEIQGLTAFAIGALAGYGSHQVFKWLDVQVNKFFPTEVAEVPDLTGKSQQDAAKLLTQLSLSLGKVQNAPSEAAKVGTIILQNPPASTKLPLHASVDITIGGPASSPEGGDGDGASRVEKPGEGTPEVKPTTRA